MNRIKKLTLYFLVLVYLSGTVGVLLRPSFFLPFTPYSLLLTTFVFLIHQNLRERSYVFAFCAVAVLGFLSEYLGIKTGWVFGDYHYGETLGLKLLGVPVCISLNWALLVNAGLLVVAQKIPHRLFASCLAAIVITGLDLVMEQLAPELDFWYFNSGRAGFHNYLGWFVISFSGSYLFYNTFKKGNVRIAAYILLLQLFFFGTLLITNRIIH